LLGLGAACIELGGSFPFTLESLLLVGLGKHEVVNLLFKACLLLEPSRNLLGLEARLYTLLKDLGEGVILIGGYCGLTLEVITQIERRLDRKGLGSRGDSIVV